MLLAQVAENVGMNIGLTPIAGIPLPLVSYGGSAMVSNLCALGLVQSVLLRRRPRPEAQQVGVPFTHSGRLFDRA